VKLPFRSLLLSLASPKLLETTGLWMIISGLIGDAIIIAFVPSGTVEKVLSAASSLVIAAGVFIEEVGSKAADAPRELSENDARTLSKTLSEFSGTPFAVETDPAAEYKFVNALIAALQRAGWRWLSYSDSLSTIPLGAGITHAGSGVQLRINSARQGDFMKSSRALARALTDVLGASVSIVADPADSYLACSPDAIHVEVRRKA
jgi:hypothetical protein